jgi:NDP-sugar pyrophosphorylase family protein
MATSGANGNGRIGIPAHAGNGKVPERDAAAAVQAIPSSPANGSAKSGTRAVILAGGRGTRLAPYTSVLPKPLMPIGERTILEIVIEQLAGYGIVDATLCVGYLSHLIEAVMGDGTSQNVTIRYVREEEALGTAAPLRLVEGLDDTFIAMNGDVLTTLDFGDLVRHHKESRSILTIATRERPIQADYGVVQLRADGNRKRVYRYDEKPRTTSTVSMGIYILEPAALEYIPPDVYFDFPDLVQTLLRADEPVEAYCYDGLWFDIGRSDDYEQAVAAWVAESVVGNGDGGHLTPGVKGALSP